MTFPIGKQYPKDDDFKAKARLHQSKYRSEILNVDFDEYGNRLTKADAVNLLNFYPKLGVPEELKNRYPKYSKGLYADMLRSEHIPFNVFAPLKQDLILAKKVFNQLLDDILIESVERIEVEYAPSPAIKYLNDRTSFDAYIEFRTPSNESGFLGIEVKYTEHDYKLKKNSKEDSDINNPDSPYNRISAGQNLFVPNAIPQLKSDMLRQIWRNHLLGESMLIHPQLDFKHFISIILYPSGNLHFKEAIPKYQSYLLPQQKHKLQGITFETLFQSLVEFNTKPDSQNWIAYLKRRYIV
jgi:hypothetical protein